MAYGKLVQPDNAIIQSGYVLEELLWTDNETVLLNKNEEANPSLVCLCIWKLFITIMPIFFFDLAP